MPKVLTSKATAFFRVTPCALRLTDEDKAAGVIRGVKIMELGKLATFEGPDGKPRKATITEKHISALLGFAGNRALPIHWTHSWHNAEASDLPNADQVELEARCGAWKQFRKDEQGNAIADAYLSDTTHKDSILFAAEHNPEDLMASAVFNYDRNDPQSLPLNFRCADFVPCGAAVTALFSEDQTQTEQPMTVEELVSMLSDPAVKAALKAIIDSHEDAGATDTEAAAMESEAGVTDADKKEEDETKPALMRAQIRISRCLSRKASELTASETAILAKAKVQASAETTALLGKGGFIKQGDVKPGEDAEAYITAQLTTGCKTRNHAIARMAKDKPELYATFRS